MSLYGRAGQAAFDNRRLDRTDPTAREKLIADVVDAARVLAGDWEAQTLPVAAPLVAAIRALDTA